MFNLYYNTLTYLYKGVVMATVENFENQRRTKMVGVKFTPEEHDELKKHCEEIGVTMSRYLRFLYKEDKKKR